MSGSIEVAIVTGSFTLGAVALTYLGSGSGLRERQQRKRAQRAAHYQKVAEVAAAADDLVSEYGCTAIHGLWAARRARLLGSKLVGSPTSCCHLLKHHSWGITSSWPG